MDNLWIWLVVGIPTPLKNILKSIWMMKNPTDGKIKDVPNQPEMVGKLHSYLHGRLPISEGIVIYNVMPPSYKLVYNPI